MLLMGQDERTYVAACVTIALVLWLRKENYRCWNEEWYTRRPQYTQENLTRNLKLSEPNDYKNAGKFHRLMSSSRLLPL